MVQKYLVTLRNARQVSLGKTKRPVAFLDLAMRPCFIFITHGNPFLSETNYVLRLLVAGFNIFSSI
jgi:hypothetical protein